ncbi:MAG: hypothetical protein ACOX8S_12445 [Christensenellales bacterium]|jgi:hypothetical protein
MAIKKISELPELNDDMAANDLIVIVDASETTQTNKSKKANANKIRIFLASQLNNNVVTTDKVDTGAIINSKLASGAVTPSKIDGLYGTTGYSGDLIYLNELGKLTYLKNDFTVVENKIVDKAIVSFIIAEENEPVEVGQKKLLWIVPPNFNGYRITDAVANIMSTSTSTMPSFDVRRGRRSSPTSQPTFYSVFNTNKKIYIDVGEFSSRNATTQYEINTYYNLVQTDDVLSFDVLTTGTGVKYLCISLEFSK